MSQRLGGATRLILLAAIALFAVIALDAAPARAAKPRHQTTQARSHKKNARSRATKQQPAPVTILSVSAKASKAGTLETTVYCRKRGLGMSTISFSYDEEEHLGHANYYCHGAETKSVFLHLAAHLKEELAHGGGQEIVVTTNFSTKRGSGRAHYTTKYTKTIYGAPKTEWWETIYGQSVFEQPFPISAEAREFAGYEAGDNGTSISEVWQNNFLSASGEFTVPAISCPSSSNGSIESSTATWVGLGGVPSSVEQTGVYSLCAGNEPEYIPWIVICNGTAPEPSDLVASKFNPSLHVNAGDTVYVSIAVANPGEIPAKKYVGTLTDLTSGQPAWTETVEQPLSVTLVAAQWLTEIQPKAWPNLGPSTWSDLSFQTTTSTQQLVENEEIKGRRVAAREPAQNLCYQPGEIDPVTHDGFTAAMEVCQPAAQVTTG